MIGDVLTLPEELEIMQDLADRYPPDMHELFLYYVASDRDMAMVSNAAFFRKEGMTKEMVMLWINNEIKARNEPPWPTVRKIRV